MDYNELESKAIFEIAKDICWDSFSDKDQEEFLQQAKEIWDQKIFDMALDTVSEVEENYR